jgi:subtilisin family serine protease
VAKKLEENPAIEVAEPNYVLKLLDYAPPQDPMFLKLWGLKNYGQDAPSGIEGVEGADIGALQAWQNQRGSKQIVVAVLDSGVDYSHPDLAANAWVNEKEKNGISGVDDDGNGYVDDIHGWDAISDNRSSLHFGQVGDPDPMDDNAHGTHCAGTIGAVGGNGIGVVGVNWNVSIMGVKFLSAAGSGSSVDEIRALKYILSNNVDIVSGSYGGGAESKLVKELLREGGEKGILFVFAAGNDSSNNDFQKVYPANYDLPNVMAVAATDARDQIADFSNYGQNTVHIAAPGVNILSTIPVGLAKEMSPYAVFSGTSMATPHVSGAAALLIAQDASLRKNPVAIKERLMNTADFKQNLAALVASGRLNIDRAIRNDTSSSVNLLGRWQEVSYPLETPRNPQRRVDNAWEIKVEGAKAMRVHIRYSQVESGFDVALLYDGQFRQVMNITGELYDYWSPIILGDTAYIKFSNAMVSVNGGEPFANFNSDGVQIDKVEVLK